MTSGCSRWPEMTCPTDMTETTRGRHREDQTAAPDGVVAGHGQRCRTRPLNPANTEQTRVHCQHLLALRVVADVIFLVVGDWSTEWEQRGSWDRREILDSHLRTANSSISSWRVDCNPGFADPLCRNVELLQTGGWITQPRYARNLPSSSVWKGCWYDVTLL